MHDSHIRPATAADLDALYALDTLAQPGSNRRESIKSWVETGTCHILFGQDVRVAAYGVLNNSFYDHGFVAMLYTLPGQRQRGYGKALMQHFESICPTPKLFTSTNLSNLPMQSLLAKLRFELCGVIHQLDENDPELVYVKPVTNES